MSSGKCFPPQFFLLYHCRLTHHREASLRLLRTGHPPRSVNTRSQRSHSGEVSLRVCLSSTRMGGPWNGSSGLLCALPLPFVSDLLS